MRRNISASSFLMVSMSMVGCLGDPSSGPGGFDAGGTSVMDGSAPAGMDGSTGGPDASTGGADASSPGDASPSRGELKALFDRTVAPALEQCAAVGCHVAPGTSPLRFMPADREAYYDTVTSYVDNVVGGFDKTRAPMLVRLVPGPHWEASYTTEQVQAIEAWLDQEKVAREGEEVDPNSPGAISKRLVREWSGCMDEGDWNREGVAVAWANLESSQGPCIRCHINGQGNFIATDQSARMFEKLTTREEFMTRYFVPEVTTATASKMVVNRELLVKVGIGQGPYLQHPLYQAEGDAMARLTRFYDATAARKAQNQCAPPRLVEP